MAKLCLNIFQKRVKGHGRYRAFPPSGPLSLGPFLEYSPNMWHSLVGHTLAVRSIPHSLLCLEVWSPGVHWLAT
jgi:hypothetical protein